MTGDVPRGVARVLAVVLPSEHVDPVLGDLADEYASRRSTQPGWRAAAGIWIETFRLCAVFALERARRDRELPPIADTAEPRASLSEAFVRDLAVGARMLSRQRAFMAVALLTLALGIGASTAIFSFVDAVLWRPLPYPAAEDMVALFEQRPREGRLSGLVAPADFVDWREGSRAFTSMAAVSESMLNLTGVGEGQRLPALSVSPGFLDTLALVPDFGRTFRAEEELPGNSHVVLLSNGLWRSHFGADPAVIGRRVLLNAVPYDVVGVLPSSFWWPTKPDVVVPLALDAADRRLRALHAFKVIARRKPGVSLAQASADMAAIGARLSEQYPVEDGAHFPRVASVRETFVGDVGPSLVVLLGAVGFVLLISCANVATLLMARGTARRKELAIRLALGAPHRRIVRQLMTESLLLASLGGACGVAFAWWGVEALRLALPVRYNALPGVAMIALDARILLTALLMTLGTSVLFGLAPAFTAARDAVAAPMNEEGRSGTTGIHANRVRSALVVLEVALSVMLLVTAMLLLASFKKLLDVSPGFEPERLLTMRVTLPQAKYGDHARIVQFYDALLERVRSMPGVDGAGIVTVLPFAGADSRAGFKIEGRDGQSPVPVRANPRLMSENYLSTLGVPLVSGRAISPRDAEGTPAVALINQAAARRFWPGQDAVGSRITFSFDTPSWIEIVGIVGDIKDAALDADSDPAVYLPYRQTAFASQARAMSVVVRTSRSLAAVGPGLRTAVRELDRDQPVGPVRDMPELIGESVAPRRLNLLLVSAFAIMAIVLTGAGLYGVLGYLVAQRTHEIGIRMALGASRGRVLVLVLRHAGAMTVAGLGLGLAGALACARLVSGLLFGISPTDPAVYAGVSVLLIAVALLAAAAPARRASRVDPLTALRG